MKRTTTLIVLTGISLILNFNLKAQNNCNTFEIFAECVKQVDACTYLATFGYDNQNPGVTFTIPHGYNNRITGATVFRGETDTVFAPGMHHNAFKIRFSCPGNIVWHLNGPFGNKSVNTSGCSAGNCVDPVKVFVKYIYRLPQGNHRAVFGYTNEGTDTVIINDPLRNFLTGTLLTGLSVINFIPGNHDSAFFADFSGSKLTWNLTSYDEVERYAIADTNYTQMDLSGIKVFVTCVKEDKDGMKTAVFGYENTGSITLSIDNGIRNRLVYEEPGNLPVTAFIPGRVDSAFSSTFSGDEMKWALVSPDGIERFAVADQDYCKKCDDKKDNGGCRYAMLPNPVSDILKIQPLFNANEVALSSEVTLHTISGHKILSYNLSNAESLEINLSNLVSGIYFVKVTNAGSTQTERIVKL